MTTNSSTTQIELDEFRQKCAELEQECLDSKAESTRLSIYSEKLEDLSAQSDHINDGLVDACFDLVCRCDGIGSEFTALGEECKVLSHTCITLGLEKSNLTLSEYAAKADELKGYLTKIEQHCTEISQQFPA